MGVGPASLWHRFLSHLLGLGQTGLLLSRDMPSGSHLRVFAFAISLCPSKEASADWPGSAYLVRLNLHYLFLQVSRDTTFTRAYQFGIVLFSFLGEFIALCKKKKKIIYWVSEESVPLTVNLAALGYKIREGRGFVIFKTPAHRSGSAIF